MRGRSATRTFRIHTSLAWLAESWGLRGRVPFRDSGTGKRAFLLYGKGARPCDSVTLASFGGKSTAFGFLWWRAEDGLVRKAAGRVARESGEELGVRIS